MRGLARENNPPIETRVLTTSHALPALKQSNVRYELLLQGYEQQVSAIVDKDFRISRSPLHMLGQFRENLALMPILRDEVHALWKDDRPDIAVVDRVVPIAGYVAQQLGAAWWTIACSSNILESPGGSPTYFGWGPSDTAWAKFRNWWGRQFVKRFKQSILWLCRKQLAEVGVTGLYRDDGSEILLSNERIYIRGARELEFNDDYSATVRYIGPLTGGPDFPHEPPVFREGRRHVLISLGTHLNWAKRKAIPLFSKVAGQSPDIDFHFTLGKPVAESEIAAADLPTNLKLYHYLPYDLYVREFDAAIIHGGTGVLYSCLAAAVPILVWPQDYDQFDFAARVTHRRLGLRCRPDARSIADDLQQLLHDETLRQRLRDFQQALSEYDPHAAFRNDLLAWAAERRCQPHDS